MNVKNLRLQLLKFVHILVISNNQLDKNKIVFSLHTEKNKQGKIYKFNCK
jgi:hypothetical protein